MSVPEGKRDIEELTVITKGRSFVARTIRICGNEKHFAKHLRWDFTQNIPSLAVDMFVCCRKANRVRVECQEDARKRLGFKYRLTDSGFVVMKLPQNKISKERRRIKRQMPHLPKKRMDLAYQSWKANAKQGITYAVLRRMDSYYYVARRKFYA